MIYDVLIQVAVATFSFFMGGMTLFLALCDDEGVFKKFLMTREEIIRRRGRK